MIIKHKCKRKSTSIFFLKRCAFLFSFLIISFCNGQIFIGDGAVIYDKDKVLTLTSDNALDSQSSKTTPYKNQFTAKIQKSYNNVNKKQRKILVTKKEIAHDNIEKQHHVISQKPVKRYILPSGNNSDSLISLGQRNAQLALLNTNHNHLAVQILYYTIANSHSVFVKQSYSLLELSYKNSVKYIYSVRPPPFLVFNFWS